MRVAPGPILLLLVVACATGEPPVPANTSVGITGASLGGSSSGTGEEASDASSGSGSGDPTTTGAEPTTGAPTSTSGEPNSEDSGPVEPMTGTSPGGTTGAACGPCDAPPGPCHEPVGACVAGECVYSPAAAQLACDDGDACTEADACDGAGGCAGAPIVCERPHASGGACEAGVCQGFTCTAPWDNCDGDWDNGCEVPVGVANQCDVNGLNPEGGCWTAYCGASNGANATNFGSYHCQDCANCNTPGPGMWQWCNHDTGTWYAPAVGNCNASEDLVCAP